MSYSPGPPDDEPPPRYLQPLARSAQRVETFVRERPVEAWLRVWLLSAVVCVPMYAAEATDAIRLSGEGILFLFAFCGWIIPLVIFIRQKKAGNDT
ncbi:MAG: hypothetical protein WBV62_18260 [Roseobacter sp.]